MAPKSALSRKLSNLLASKKSAKKPRFNPQSTMGKIEAAKARMARLQSKRAFINAAISAPDGDDKESGMESEDEQNKFDVQPLPSLREGLSIPSQVLCKPSNYHQGKAPLGDLTSRGKLQIAEGSKSTTSEKSKGKCKIGAGPDKKAPSIEHSGASIEVKDMLMSTGTGREAPSNKTAGRSTAQGLLSVLDDHATSGRLFQPAINLFKTQHCVPESVLFRRTARAEKWRKAHPELFKKSPKSSGCREMMRGLKVKGSEEKWSFPILKLVYEIRNMIWRQVVIEDKVFIWPDSKLGREQPDLAMVNRQIRAEVLPIYYAENIFALDISPATTMLPRNPWPSTATTSVNIDTWAKILQEAGQLKFIRHWAFSYTLPDTWFDTNVPGQVQRDDENCVVSVRLRKGSSPFIEAEIHRDAYCLLSGLDSKHDCTVSETSERLAVHIRDFEEFCQGGPTAGFVLALEEFLRARADTLPTMICQNRQSGY